MNNLKGHLKNTTDKNNDRTILTTDQSCWRCFNWNESATREWFYISLNGSTVNNHIGNHMFYNLIVFKTTHFNVDILLYFTGKIQSVESRQSISKLLLFWAVHLPSLPLAYTEAVHNTALEAVNSDRWTISLWKRSFPPINLVLFTAGIDRGDYIAVGEKPRPPRTTLFRLICFAAISLALELKLTSYE